MSAVGRFLAGPARRLDWRGPLAALVAFPLCWGHLSPLLGRAYSPDSYGYALLGRELVTRGRYASPAVRDFHQPRAFPQPSRSFPPLWPLAVGLAQRLTGRGIAASAIAGGAVLLLTLLAAGRFARRAAGAAAPLLCASFPLYFLCDGQYRDELASGRAIPLAMLLLILLFDSAHPWFEEAPLPPRAAAWSGALLAGLALTRFDQAPFAVAALAATALRARWVGARAALRETAIAGLAGGALLLPWALRNLALFGTPFASDNTLTALSTQPGLNAIQYFAPGRAPATLAAAPALWLQQRLHYFADNLRVISRLGGAAWALLALLIGRAWRDLVPADRRLARLMAAHGGLTVAAVSLTSFHDRRYFSPLLCHAALFGALALARLLGRRARPRIALTAAAWLIFAAVALPPTWRALRHPGGALAGLSPPRAPEREWHAAALPALRAAIPAAAVVATESPEDFAWYTGYRAIYLPGNAAPGADFDAWRRHWRPDYFLVTGERLSRLAPPPGTPVADFHLPGFTLLRATDPTGTATGREPDRRP